VLDLAAIEPPTAFARWVGLVGTDRRSAIGGVVAVVVVVGFGWVLLRPDPPRSEELIPLAASTVPPPATAGSGSGTAPPTTAAATVLAHAAGAVVAPGLYELAPDSRIADLVRAAGGPAPDADLDRLNLAAVVADGSRVYVPVVGEQVLPEPLADPVPAAPPGGEGDPSTVPGPVDLNTATLDELDELPGIGPATAQAIVDHRTSGGPFTSVDELLEVRGIGEAKLADLRDLVTVG
jgi:competence protein ComEA